MVAKSKVFLEKALECFFGETLKPFFEIEGSQVESLRDQ